MRLNHIPREKLKVLADKFVNSPASLDAANRAAYEIIRKSGLFDDEFYQIKNPDVKQSGLDPLRHFCDFGWREGRDPNIWFQTEFYRQENYDLNPDINPLIHYICMGFAQGRRPNRHAPKTYAKIIVSVAPKFSDYDSIFACLKSLLTQSLKPEKILVYLARSEFANKNFTFNFIELIDQGVEIRWCESLELYNNLLPALSEYPHDILITCSTRYTYDNDFIKRLLDAYHSEPGSIYCCTGIEAYSKDNGLHFNFGTPNNTTLASSSIIPLAESGMLVPPEAWDSTVFDSDTYMRYAHDFPDLWYWLMSLRNGVKVKIIASSNSQIIKSELLDGLVGDDAQIVNFEHQAISLLYYFREDIARSCDINFYNDIIQGNVKKLYKENLGEELDLMNPKSFSEKMHYLKVYDDLPLKTLLADKYLARKYISSKIGEKYLVPLLGVWASAEDIDFEKLPDSFVLKTNHASGTNIVVGDKRELKVDEAKSKLNRWLAKNYGTMWWELNYLLIKPLIICEQYLGENINDYKFICMNGNPVYCWVDIDRFSSHKRNFYSMDWQKKDIKLVYPNSDKIIPKPKYLPEMIKIASILSQPFKHARIDFFITASKLYVGEITFYSEAGLHNFEPQGISACLADQIEVSR